jgi:polyketide biosynthesis enoyl-CoA hydratase PksH
MVSAAMRVVVPPRLDAQGVDCLSQALRAALLQGTHLVLVGSAPEVFCTGLDLAVDGADMAEGAALLTSGFAELLIDLWQAPLPTLAVVDGPALGGGMGLVAACDRIIATPQATFGLPEMLWGLVPAIIWPTITTRLTTPRARWWALTGRARTATEALAEGFVDEVVPSGELMSMTTARLRDSRRADRSALPLLRSLSGPGIAAAIRAGSALTHTRLAEPEVRRRLNSFALGDAPW